MRHRSKTVKLKRNASHRKALLANLACTLARRIPANCPANRDIRLSIQLPP